LTQTLNEGTTPGFADNIEKLESIVERLEHEDMPLETMIGLFEEGMRLSRICKDTLDESQARVDMLVEKNGALHEVPFEE
jgi:exodeoxyribonuclease VII small subunit